MNPKLKALERTLIEHSPTILSGLAVAGTLTTAYLTATATLEAAEILNDPNEEIREKLRWTWKLYIPAASSGALTVATIVMANRVGNKRAAALAAAYKLSETAYSEYRERVVETIGDKKEREIRDTLASSRVVHSSNAGNLLVVSDGRERCYDSFSGQYFESDHETIRRAVNDVNAELLDSGYVSLTEFYNRIGLPQTSVSEALGWRDGNLMDVTYSSVLHEGKTYLAIDFTKNPVPNYNRYG